MRPASFPQFADHIVPVHAGSIAQGILACNPLADSLFASLRQSQCVDSIAPNTPGGRLRAARERAGKTQVQIRAETGITQSALSEFETGKNESMDAMALARVCRALGVTVEHVVFGAVDADTDADELLARLRHAQPAARDMALSAVRAMLPLPTSTSRKREANGR